MPPYSTHLTPEESGNKIHTIYPASDYNVHTCMGIYSLRWSWSNFEASVVSYLLST